MTPETRLASLRNLAAFNLFVLKLSSEESLGSSLQTFLKHRGPLKSRELLNSKYKKGEQYSMSNTPAETHPFSTGKPWNAISILKKIAK